MRWPTWIIGALLLVVQADLWLGKGNLPYVMRQNERLAEQLTANEVASQRNLRVAAEVSDLKEGLEMVEDKARTELGMLRPDEILVTVTRPR